MAWMMRDELSGNFMKLLVRAPEEQAIRRLHRAAFIAAAGVVVFAVLAVFVNARAFAALDLAVARSVHTVNTPSLDVLSEALAIIFSGELSLVYGGLLAMYFWRRGPRVGVLAVLAFLPLVFVEIVLKYVVQQPPVPDDLYRGFAYPLANVTTQGSFPSGHAARAAFFAVFLGILGRSPGGLARWLAPLVAALVALACAFSRLYQEVHWASDVVAGAILGAAIGYLAVCWVEVAVERAAHDEARP